MKKTTLAAGFAALAIGSVAVAAPGAMKDKGPQTLAQAQTKAAAMFERMDANKDGKLDAADRAARRAQHFAKLDANKDGAISRAEFDAGHAARGDRMQGDHAAMGHARMTDGGHRDGKRGHRMGGAMRMADTNKDGTITRAEFDAGVKTMFARTDTDGNGTVTAEERKAAHEAMRDRMRQSRPDATAD